MYVCIYFWLHWVFDAAWLFSSLGEQGLLCSCVWDSHCSDFFCCRAWSLGAWALVLAHMRAVKPGLSSRGTWSPTHVGSSLIRDRTCVLCFGRWILYHWATREVHEYIFKLDKLGLEFRLPY